MANRSCLTSTGASTGAPDADEALAFRWYDSERGVAGRRVADHLSLAVCYRHSFSWPGQGSPLPHRVILLGMTHRVGPKGQVVIPKELRDELCIEPGDEVSFWRHDDHVAVRPTDRRRPLRGRFCGSPLVDQLIAERSADREREDGR